MRVVLFPAHVVDADLVAQRETHGIGDEAGEDVVAEHLRWHPAVAEVGAGPRVVHLEGSVEPVEEVGDPAGPAFRQRDLQCGELLEHP